MIMKKDNVERVVTDPLKINRLKGEGYIPISGEEIKEETVLVEDIASPANTEEVAEQKKINLDNLKEKTVAELREIAKEYGIAGCSNMSKDSLVAVIEAVAE